MTDQPPCPMWCRRPQGHDLELDPAGVARRVHLGVPAGGVEAEQFETVTSGVSVSSRVRFVSAVPAGRVA